MSCKTFSNLDVSVTAVEPLSNDRLQPRRADSRMSLRIKRISDLNQLDTVAHRQWNALPMPSPMQSAEWLTAWWQTFGNEKGHHLCLLLVYDDNRLVGVAPWYFAKAWGGADCLRFLGDGAVCSDHATILAEPQYRDDVLELLSEWINSAAGTQFHTIAFESIDGNERATRQLVERLAQSGCDSSLRATVGCWTIELPTTWDEFLTTLSKNHRKRCRRWFRDYFESGRARVQTYSADEVGRGWEEISKLNLERRAHVGDRSAFVDERFHRFHLSVLPDLVASGRAELRTLLVDGDLVAAEYILFLENSVFCYQSGMTTSTQRDGFGNLSILSMLYDSIDRGYRRLDFLRGDESYKQHWGAVREACDDLLVTTPSIKGAAHAAYYRTYDWLRETFSQSSA